MLKKIKHKDKIVLKLNNESIDIMAVPSRFIDYGYNIVMFKITTNLGILNKPISIDLLEEFKAFTRKFKDYNEDIFPNENELYNTLCEFIEVIPQTVEATFNDIVYNMKKVN